MNMKNWKRAICLLLCSAVLLGNFPAVSVAAAEEILPVCTGLADCDAEEHNEGCQKAAVNAVAAMIEALPSLEELQSKPLEEQSADYAQVQSAYGAYEALADEQKELLPSAEEVFKPYFDYFNGQTCEAAVIASGTAENGSNNKITWVLDDAGTLTLSGTGFLAIWSPGDSPWYEYRSSIKKVVIQSGITAIRSYQFYDCQNMTSITIPDTVTDISWGAFEKCKSLTAITLPSKITEINNWTFRNCESLKKITIPSGVTSIGDSAFENCYALVSVTIPNTVTSIGANAFFDCSKLSGISIPSGVTSIEAQAFYSCEALSSVSIPGTVKSIGDYAFYGCESLKRLTIPSGVESIGKVAFCQCTGLTSISLPDTLTTIGNNAFEECNALTSVTIPKGVTSIGNNPFRLCAKLTTINVSSGNRSFRSVSNVLYTYDYSRLITVPLNKTGNFTVNSGTKTIGAGAFTANQLTAILLPSSVTVIDQGAFSRSVNLTSISIPDEVTELGEYMFYNCKELADITLPESLVNIGEYVFMSCTSLTSLTIPEHVSSIGNFTFMGSSQLREITFTGSAPAFGNYTFYGITATCYYPSGDPSWTDAVKQNYNGTITWVSNCNGGHTYDQEVATETYLKSAATCTAKAVYYKSCTCGAKGDDTFTYGEINASAHHYVDAVCSSCGLPEGLEYSISNGEVTVTAYTGSAANLVIPATIEGKPVTGIGEKAFSNCTKLQNVTLPVGLNQIDNYAFEGCSSIRSMVLPEGLVSLGDMVFRDCVAMTTVTLPDSITTVGQFLFTNCSALREIEIPAGLTEITAGMFDLCTALETITIPETVSSIGEYAFYYCSGLKQITFEGDLDTIHRKAFAGVTATAYYPREYEGWTEDALRNYSGTITWKAYCRNAHEFNQEVAAEEYLVSEATCTAKAVYYLSCVCGKAGAGTFEYGQLKQHDYTDSVTPPTCTEQGYTTHTCHCGDSYVDSFKDALNHDMGQWVTTTEATCTEDGEKRRDCSRCDHFETEAIPASGHEYKAVVTAPTCTEQGYTTHTCHCGDSYVDSYEDKLGHNMGQWVTTSEPTADAAGEKRRDCSRCDFFETSAVQYQGNFLWLKGEEFADVDTVWINGLPYPVGGTDDNRYVTLPFEGDFVMVTYTYHVGDANDVHTQYPTGMKVYKVKDGKITHIPELDDLLRYSGSSIRITGKKGIRMITSLTKENKAALTGKGLAGYKLLEYGTALCWASEIAEGDALVLGREFTRSNYAYKKGVADPVFATSGNLIQYTNVLVGFSLDQCKDDIAMRPYIILEDANGEQITLYGGTIYRSIGYIAYQNRNVFTPKTTSYNYVWEIIHHVYGDKYDADYKG